MKIQQIADDNGTTVLLHRNEHGQVKIFRDGLTDGRVFLNLASARAEVEGEHRPLKWDAHYYFDSTGEL